MKPDSTTPEVLESSFVLRLFRSFVRQRGLAFSADYCKAEDLQTNFVDIGPVNKVYNMLSWPTIEMMGPSTSACACPTTCGSPRTA